MGKDLKGKQLGTGLSQRKDGRYQARLTTNNGKRIETCRCERMVDVSEVHQTHINY